MDWEEVIDRIPETEFSLDKYAVDIIVPREKTARSQTSEPTCEILVNRLVVMPSIEIDKVEAAARNPRSGFLPRHTPHTATGQSQPID